jgi:hypothetical protein
VTLPTGNITKLYGATKESRTPMATTTEENRTEKSGEFLRSQI